MHLIIISLTKTVLDDSNIDSVTLPGMQGNFQVLRNHINMISQLISGTVSYVHEGQPEPIKIEIKEGIVTVHKNNIVVIVD